LPVGRSRKSGSAQGVCLILPRTLEALGEGGWLKALELEEYAARSRNNLETLQGALFPYLEAL
jgi:hypothetical protein